MSENSIASGALTKANWRTPLIVILCGCAISLITFGPRSATGLFMQPVSEANGWGRDVFSLAFAIQKLLWGVVQPFAGAIADRFGTVRVLCCGAVLYAVGLVLMAYSTTPLTLNLTAGVLIGFGLAGCSFTVVIGALGKLMPEQLALVGLRRRHGRRFVRAVPVLAARGALIDAFGWQTR